MLVKLKKESELLLGDLLLSGYLSVKTLASELNVTSPILDKCDFHIYNIGRVINQLAEIKCLFADDLYDEAEEIASDSSDLDELKAEIDKNVDELFYNLVSALCHTLDKLDIEKKIIDYIRYLSNTNDRLFGVLDTDLDSDLNCHELEIDTLRSTINKVIDSNDVLSDKLVDILDKYDFTSDDESLLPIIEELAYIADDFSHYEDFTEYVEF